MKEKLIKIYLEWRNDFLTIDYFAEHYGITKTEAKQLIKMGKKYHNENCNNLIKKLSTLAVSHE